MTADARPAAARARFMFVPVSGPTGMGEYARCRTLAQAVLRQFPDADIHFLLSEQAPYARSTPHDYTLFPGSPTLHDEAGRAAIRGFRPDVIVFDNAGRRGQLATAHALGAGVVYISSRWRPRSKAFRLRWLPYIDEHWIPYPEDVGGALTMFERLKQRLVGRPRVRFLDVMLPLPGAEAESVLDRRGLVAKQFTLVVAGGGTPHPNAHPNARRAPAIYDEVASRIAAAGHRVVVAGRDAPDGAPSTGPTWTGRVPPDEIAVLLRAARLVVTNGGDTLLQSLACGRATVAAPIAADQPARLALCVRRGGVVAAELDVDALSSAALALLDDTERRTRLEAEARALGLRSGVDVALDAFRGLLERRAPRAVSR